MSFSSKKQLSVCQMVNLKYQNFLDILSDGLRIVLSTRTPSPLFLVPCHLHGSSAVINQVFFSNYLHIKSIQFCNRMMSLSSRLNGNSYCCKGTTRKPTSAFTYKVFVNTVWITSFDSGWGLKWPPHLHIA